MNNIESVKKRIAQYIEKRKRKEERQKIKISQKERKKMIKKLGLKPNRTYKRVFDDKEKLQKMLVLRDVGWSYNALAIRFNVDHSSIIYQCQKHKELFNQPDKLTIYKKDALKEKYKYKDLLNERICKGKNYAEYLKESLDKKLKI